MAQTDSMTITTMFRGQEQKVCHSDKEIDDAVKDGFKPYNPADHAYPRWMYKGAESRLVQTESDAAGWTKKGWTGKPTEAFAGTLATTDVPALPDAALVQHETVLAGLAEKILELSARLTALEDNATQSNNAPKE